MASLASRAIEPKAGGNLNGYFLRPAVQEKIGSLEALSKSANSSSVPFSGQGGGTADVELTWKLEKIVTISL